MTRLKTDKPNADMLMIMAVGIISNCRPPSSLKCPSKGTELPVLGRHDVWLLASPAYYSMSQPEPVQICLRLLA